MAEGGKNLTELLPSVETPERDQCDTETSPMDSLDILLQRTRR